MSDYRSRLEAALQARYKGTPGQWTDDIDREIAHTAVCEALKRAMVLLDATRRFIQANPIAEFTVLYDEAQCDGYCLSDDCEVAYAMGSGALRVASGEETPNGK